MALPLDTEVIDATIAAGAALSGAVAIGAKTLVGIAMPSAWTTAGLTFQVSVDGGGTWLELYSDAGSEIDFTVAASQFIQVDPATWRGINMVKVRSGTASAAVNQVAAAVIGLVVRPELS